jgi:predicted GIY-YIG superfamily endonuclease
MRTFVYVYILASDSNEGTHYTGVTRDPEKRLLEHNHRKCPNTARHGPWRIETAAAFRSQAKARAFEKYLKSGSGREFAPRHF